MTSIPRVTRIVLTVVGCLVGVGAAMAKDQWKKITAPNFTILTSANDKDALKLAGEFTQFVTGLHGFIPVNDVRLPKLTLVLFGRERDFEAYRPLREDGKAKEVGGFFWRCDSWAVAALPGAYLDDETRHTFFHESTHWYVSAFNLPNPVWLEEGLAEVFSTFKVEDKKVRWGDAIGPHVVLLNVTDPMPLEKLLFLPQSDLFTGDREGEVRTGLAYAESWAFVHYLIFGQSEVPPQALNEYVRLLRTMNPDVAFQKAFGHSYAEVDRKFADYLHNGRFYVVSRPAAAQPAFQIEPATPAEVELGLGQVALAGARFGEATKHAQAAIVAAPELSGGYELLGRAAEVTGDTQAALTAFDQAVERHSRDAHAYFEASAIRQRQLLEEDPSGTSLLPADARRQANNYERAINLNPLLEDAYAALAGVLEVVAAPNDQDAAFIGQGISLFPHNPVIRIGRAVLAHKGGKDEEAKQTLAAVMKAPDISDKVRAYAQRLESSWGEKDALGGINALVKQKKYTEALAGVEQQLAAGTDMMATMRLRTMRDFLVPLAKNEQAVKAFREQRWADARKLFGEVIESNATPLVKTQARSRIQEMDRRHLGENETTATETGLAK